MNIKNFKRSRLNQSIMPVAVAGKMVLASSDWTFASTIRVDMNNAGDIALKYAQASDAVISGNGRYIAYVSDAVNLDESIVDDNGSDDIFVYDKQTQITELVSLDSSGNISPSGASSPSITEDGRYIAFYASAALDSNFSSVYNTIYYNAIYVHDRVTGQTSLVSVPSDGSIVSNGQYIDAEASSPHISSNGQFVVFESDNSNMDVTDRSGAKDIFVRNLNNRTTQRVSVNNSGKFGGGGNANSYNPTISADGQFIAFTTYANNLVANDDNNAGDVMVVNRATGEIVRINLAPNGTEANDDSFKGCNPPSALTNNQ